MCKCAVGGGMGEQKNCKEEKKKNEKIRKKITIYMTVERGAIDRKP